MTDDIVTSQTAERGGLDLTRLAVAAWRRRRLVALVAGLCAVAAALASYTRTPTYTAQVTLLPFGNTSTPGLLSEVAGFTGLTLDTGSNFEQFYGRIATSDRVIGAALDRRWRHAAFADSVTLLRILDIDLDPASAEDARIARAKATGKIRKQVVSFYRDNRSGYMILRVELPGDPRTAADLANFLADQLDEFNRLHGTKQAGEQRAFLEARIAEVGRTLDQAAARVAEFATQNRSYRESPRLLQAYGALERELQAQTTAWVELRRQLELARIEERRELVSVNILDRAQPPIRRSSPSRILYLACGGAFGLLLALLIVLVRDREPRRVDR